MILDSSQKDSPLLFADDRTDLTQQVIAAYNAKSGITAPVTEAISARGDSTGRQPRIRSDRFRQN